MYILANGFFHIIDKNMLYNISKLNNTRNMINEKISFLLERDIKAHEGNQNNLKQHTV